MGPLRILFIAFIGQVLFIYGFLPIKIARRKAVEDELLPSNIGGLRVYPDSLFKPVVNKVILMVIDALRDDFIAGPDASHHMPYLSSLIDDGEGVHFTSRVEPPTVTLPRIKAMTMGIIPNYADVILNVLERESNSSKGDSFIGRSSLKHLNTVFYGDDTWLRIFPNSFLRSDGTSSFYVSDFNEVDDNVTRHLDNELRRDDWDIMILHYLGLDHIGHVHGPYSKLVPPKLLEMDDVIQKLHLGLKKMANASLLVICGDHGMKDTGGHGGASHSETHVPLVFVSPSSVDSKRYCRESSVGGGIVNQRDLAPTLSVLLGLPPPSMNLGSAIQCILRKFIPETDAYLYALHVNAWQVASLLDSGHDSSKDGSYLFEEASELHSRWIKSKKSELKSQNDLINYENYIVKNIAEKYAMSISLMTSKLAESLVNFDYYTMFVGVIIAWQALLMSMLKKNIAIFECGLANTFLLFVIILVFHFNNCYHGPSIISISSLCQSDPATLLFVIFLAYMLSANFLGIFHGYHSFKVSRFKERLKVISSPVYSLLTFGTFLHIISLFSSSFIEEEHQTWQFLSISLVILLGLRMYHHVPHKSINYLPSRSDSLSLAYSDDVEEQNVHFTSIHDCAAFSHHKKEWVNVIMVLFLHRVLRDYNHTGDKWGHLPDIGDWISEPENIGIRSAIMVLSLIGITLHLILNSPSKFEYSNGLFLILAAPCLYAYRAAIGDVSSLNIYPSSRGTNEFYILLIFMALILISGCFKAFNVLTHGGGTSLEKLHDDTKKSRTLEKPVLAAFVILSHELCKFWVMLCSSLNRPGDIFILLAFLFCCQALAAIIMKTGRFDVHTMSKTFVWIGMVFYFFKGNSNSLASVDLKAAYTGQDNYSMFIVGILLFCHTFSMPVLALLLLFHYLAIAVSRVHNFDFRCTRRTMDAAVTSVSMTRLFPLVVYLPFIIVQRHHLFIWTVFAPKLIYEAFFTLATLCGLCTVIILLRCLRHLAKLWVIWSHSSVNV